MSVGALLTTTDSDFLPLTQFGQTGEVRQQDGNVLSCCFGNFTGSRGMTGYVQARIYKEDEA